MGGNVLYFLFFSELKIARKAKKYLFFVGSHGGRLKPDDPVVIDLNYAEKIKQHALSQWVKILFLFV